MKNSKIRVMVFRCGKDGEPNPPPEVVETTKIWTLAKELIGEHSLVEITGLDDGVEIYSDEEALIKNLPLNREFPAQMPEYPEGFEIINVTGRDLPKPGTMGVYAIRGNCLLARHDHENDSDVGLTDDDIAKYKNL